MPLNIQYEIGSTALHLWQKACGHVTPFIVKARLYNYVNILGINHKQTLKVEACLLIHALTF